MIEFVIVGAGYTGVWTARKFEKLIKKNKLKGEGHITLIDKNPYMTYICDLNAVAGARLTEDVVKIDLKEAFKKSDCVTVVQDKIVDFNLQDKYLVGERKKYQYDYVVLCAGAEPNLDMIPGAADYAFKMGSVDDAVHIREHIEECFRKAQRESSEEARRSFLNFYVLGAGLNGVQMVGEIAEYVPILCKEFRINRKEVSITIIDACSRVAPIMTEKQSARIEKRLKKMGVTIKTRTHVSEIGDGYIEYETDFDNKKTEGKIIKAESKAVFVLFGNKGAEITKKFCESLNSGKGDRLMMDSFFRSTDNKDIFIGGDNVLFVKPGTFSTVPQNVDNAIDCATRIAMNLILLIKNSKGEKNRLNKPRRGSQLHVCTVGGKYAVGDYNKKYVKIPFISPVALLIKFLRDFHLYKMLGGSKAAIRFFVANVYKVKNRRSLFGGHYVRNTLTFKTVPLRIMLGAVFLAKAIANIYNNWMSKPTLAAFLTSTDDLFNDVVGHDVGIRTGNVDQVVDSAGELITQIGNSRNVMVEVGKGVTSTVDAISHATNIVPAGTKLLEADIFKIFKLYLVSDQTLERGSFKLSSCTLRGDLGLVNQVVKDAIIGNDNLQIWVQRIVILIEVLIGVSLIIGFMTHYASRGVMIFQTLILFTTGIPLYSFWIVCAAKVCLYNGGESFGLDYYWKKHKESGP